MARTKIRISTLFSLALCVFLLGCADRKEDASRLTDGYQSDKQLMEKDNEMYRCYAISGGKKPATDDFVSESEALKRLRALDPIEIPTVDINPTVAEQRQLLATYKSFLNQYEGDKAMIRQFRSIYAKLLLVTYDVLETGNSKDAAFLIEELIKAETGRFKFMLTSLSRLSKRDMDDTRRLAKLMEPQIKGKIEAMKLAKQKIEDIKTMGDPTNDIENENDGQNRKAKFLLAEFSRIDLEPEIEKLEKYHRELSGWQ